MLLVKDLFTLHKRFRIACHDIITITRRLVFCVLLENASVLTEKAIRNDRDSSRLIFLLESTLPANEGYHLKRN